MKESTPAVTPDQSPADQRDPALLDTATLAAICKALGHPARVRIVEHLKAIDNCICGEIVQILPLAQSTVSQHLKLLKNAGLVKGEVEGPRTCYCLDRDMLERFKHTVGSI
jgi:ArsR family transcriptional regulator